MAQAGIEITTQASPSTVVLTDRFPSSRVAGPVRAHVMIVAPVANECRRALDALAEGFAAVPTAVLALARRVQALSERQQNLLVLVARGHTSAAVARELTVSEATREARAGRAPRPLRRVGSARIVDAGQQLGLLDEPAPAASVTQLQPRDDARFVALDRRTSPTARSRARCGTGTGRWTPVDHEPHPPSPRSADLAGPEPDPESRENPVPP